MDDTVYVHNNSTYVGCYAVMVGDSMGNISDTSNIVCIDEDACSAYDLPNAFTPNGDNFNDFYKALNFVSANRIDLTIFNRWGKKVYHTTDPAFTWDGKSMENHRDCSDGVYFYVCDVYLQTLSGEKKQTLKGSVEILR
jgi:gliding motility-associated-like protein